MNPNPNKPKRKRSTKSKSAKSAGSGWSGRRRSKSSRPASVNAANAIATPTGTVTVIPQSPAETSSRKTAAATTPSNPITCEDIFDAAVMSCSRADAAVHLMIPKDRLDELLTRADMADAWLRGRAKIMSTVHAKLIDAALNGNVTAIKEVLKRLDKFRDDVATIAIPDDGARNAEADDRRSREDAPASIRISDFAADFESMMKGRKIG